MPFRLIQREGFLEVVADVKTEPLDLYRLKDAVSKSALVHGHKVVRVNNFSYRILGAFLCDYKLSPLVALYGYIDSDNTSKMTCKRCGNADVKQSFERVINGKSYLSCEKCIDLKLQIYEFLQEIGCVNTMELCRALNGVLRIKDCVSGHKFGITRTWDTLCNASQLGCVFKYTKVYSALAQLEKKGVIQSEKTRFWDITPLSTDTFRFWFINRDDYVNRVEKQKLTGYLSRTL
ncbi:MAG: hypothetical protein QM398_02465 [Thermoproteota archaeon]|nr:hypothetical protein [Thermoproteota archaeon]